MFSCSERNTSSRAAPLSATIRSAFIPSFCRRRVGSEVVVRFRGALLEVGDRFQNRLLFLLFLFAEAEESIFIHEQESQQEQHPRRR